MIGQRRVTLYGVRARETPEDANEREIRKQIRSSLPELFGGEWDHLEFCKSRNLTKAQDRTYRWMRMRACVYPAKGYSPPHDLNRLDC